MASVHRPANPRHFRFLLIIAIIVISTLSHVKGDDLSSDRAALLAFRNAVGPALPWNLSSTSPCTWQGILCSGNRVTEIHLPGASLSGQVPTGTIGNLTALQTLSMRYNAISNLPSDLTNCVKLKYLYLHSNHFSGNIPVQIFSLSLLVKLDLSANHFTGDISLEFNNLDHLKTLYLDSNNLTGILPDINITKLESFNVSYNQLTGPVPAALQRMPSTAFLGTSLCGGPLAPCQVTPSPPTTATSTPPPPSAPTQSKKGGGLSAGAIAGILIGCVFALLLVIGLIFFISRRRRIAATKATTTRGTKAREVPAPMQKESTSSATVSSGKKLVFVGNAPVAYDLEDLLRASAEVLGKGTFGTTYKATLESTGGAVAVKRLKDVVHVPEKEFREKIAAIGAMQHPNLLPLQSYYYSKDEKLLVYDFARVGSLSSLLHGNNGSGRHRLGFTARLRIALSAALGVEYIHSISPRSSHGNIKTSNIVISESGNALVADQGVVQLVATPSMPKRSVGYRAPEVTDAGKTSQKADVYSFGVTLLELLTGKAPAPGLSDDKAVDLPNWVRSVVHEEWTAEVFDVELLKEDNVEEDLMQLLQIGIDSTERNPDQRPAMPEVVARIERISENARQRRNDGRAGGAEDRRDSQSGSS